MAEEFHTRSPRDYFFGEILGLPPGAKDPDFYTLLGVPFFESDHGAIVRAAIERIRLLETCQADPRPGYQAALQRLLAEVRDAQMTLLDPKRRPAYDAKLTGRGSEGAAGEEAAAASDAEVDHKPGTMLAGRYRVLAEARKGGLGVVYDALDGNLRTRVQVSVLRPALSKDKAQRRRIEQAARAAAALAHPHILGLDEVGDAEGLLFVRTRPPEGKSVVELIEGTQDMRLDPARAREIAAAVARALVYAHEAGAVHGDLRPQAIYADTAGHVLVADFCVARAVADSGAAPVPPTRPPEGDASPAGDLFSLGCILYQMLAGMPPFTSEAVNYRPAPLPGGVPADLEALVMRCLAREPQDRPASAAEVAERLVAVPPKRRRTRLLAGGAVVLVAALAALLGRGTQPAAPAESSLKAEAWKLVANRNFEEATRRLREALAADPAQHDLHAPLAGALEGLGAVREREGAIWEAQRLFAEAEALEPHPERAAAVARVRTAAGERLREVRVGVEPVASQPTVRVEGGDVPLAKAEVAGAVLAIFDGRASRVLEFPEGRHEVPYLLVDGAGNERRGTLSFRVDRTAPVLEVIEPAEGASFAEKTVAVRVRVRDDNPEETIRVRGRAVRLVSGEASVSLDLDDGTHPLDIVARDLAGHTTTETRTVYIETRAPVVELAAKRIVFARGPVAIRGRLRTAGSTLAIDGRAATPDGEGAFVVQVPADRDRSVPVEAVGPTGIRRVVAVDLVLDDDAPVVALSWERTDKKGVLLYGAREMDGGLLVPVRVLDKTAVVYEPSEGTIEDSVWRLPAHEGEREVSLVARDEAGNETRVVYGVEGHRSVPLLEVKGNIREVTTDAELTLDIAADDRLLVQGAESATGRVRIPLPEGETAILVQAIDHYGNESRWEKRILADRTAPALRLVGEEERGIGRQELELESDEDLATVTCVGRTFEVKGRRARFEADLQPGRRSLHVVARDLAGNETKAKFNVRVVNRALRLDGRSAVRVALPPNLGDFTLECWVKGGDPTGREVVAGTAPGTGFSIVWSSADKSFPYAAVEQQGSGLLTVPVRKAWKWDQWTHLALCRDAKRVRFFVNGSLQGQGDFADVMRPPGAELVVGGESDGRGGGMAFFRGAIDELRLSSGVRYPRAFTPAKFHREDEQTLLLFRFDVLAEGRHVDGSGKRRDATAIGKPELVEEER